MASKPVGGASAEAAIAAAHRPPSAPDTETALLDAALAEVLEHGIRRTTASDIARRARVSRQTLYRYWPDAQAVFAALVTRELLAALPDGARDPQDLDDLVDVVVDTADRIRRMPLLERLRDTDPDLLRAVRPRAARHEPARDPRGSRPPDRGRRSRGRRTPTPPRRWCCSSCSRRCSPRRSWRSGCPTIGGAPSCVAPCAGYLGRRRMNVRILGRTPASSALNAARRTRELAALADHPVVDVVVIGGGITGAGLALDAASRGLRTVLVERHDLAHGTSRWSSKLVHGGLRYLASGQLGIAHESAAERHLLLTRIAPHLTRPLAQVVPLYAPDHLSRGAFVGAGYGMGDGLRRFVGTPTAVLDAPRRIGSPRRSGSHRRCAPSTSAARSTAGTDSSSTTPGSSSRWRARRRGTGHPSSPASRRSQRDRRRRASAGHADRRGVRRVGARGASARPACGRASSTPTCAFGRAAARTS